MIRVYFEEGEKEKTAYRVDTMIMDRNCRFRDLTYHLNKRL